MKKCNDCNKTFLEAGNYCPDCGLPLIDAVCPNCGKLIENEGAVFCSNCGSRIDASPTSEKSAAQSHIQNAVDKLTENEFVKSVKKDFENSQSVNMVKDKVKDVTENVKDKAAEIPYYKKKKIGIFAGIAAVIIVLLIIAANIHTCEECDKVYIGKKHSISFWGQSEDVCKDCYNDFYGGWQ